MKFRVFPVKILGSQQQKTFATWQNFFGGPRSPCPPAGYGTGPVNRRKERSHWQSIHASVNITKIRNFDSFSLVFFVA